MPCLHFILLCAVQSQARESLTNECTNRVVLLGEAADLTAQGGLQGRGQRGILPLSQRLV